MSDNNLVPARLPKCQLHPETEPKRLKVVPGLDMFVCAETECESGRKLGWACMSEQSGDLCRFIRHTTATHMNLAGQTWVDVDLNKADVEVALGDEEVETEIV